METKYCNKCKKTKPLSEFSKDKTKKDGFRTCCKICSLKTHKDWRNRNRDKVRARNKAWDLKNPDNILKRKKKYRLKASAKEKERQYNKAWDLKNPDKRNAIVAKRRAVKLQSTPPWLSKQQLAEIASFYRQAKVLEIQTGIKHHVDHIIPLQGKEVCGLHTPWNLQILTAKENIKKGNKM